MDASYAITITRPSAPGFEQRIYGEFGDDAERVVTRMLRGIQKGLRDQGFTVVTVITRHFPELLP